VFVTSLFVSTLYLAPVHPIPCAPESRNKKYNKNDGTNMSCHVRNLSSVPPIMSGASYRDCLIYLFILSAHHSSWQRASAQDILAESMTKCYASGKKSKERPLTLLQTSTAAHFGSTRSFGERENPYNSFSTE
jgi:hypothetical protein